VGPEKLLGMACSFGFGRKLDTEIETSQPVCPFPEAGDDFGVAQIASGFNRTTLITPVNGAAFVAAIVNDGVYLEPSIVLGVTDEDGRLVYESIKKEVGSVCSPPAALEIRKMMEETITGGTARRLFSGYAKDPVLGQLELGGKTGSINDGVVPNVRYDWFVGYARERGGSRALAVASVVAHEKFIGKRAAHYAKEAFRFFFADLEKRPQT
jgi:cell division protein FtsI/penicillin-binding protein 2